MIEEDRQRENNKRRKQEAKRRNQEEPEPSQIKENPNKRKLSESEDAVKKRKLLEGQEKVVEPKNGNDEDSDEEIADEVKLWVPGWKQRYYESKFNISAEDHERILSIAKSYTEGFSWVLKYYYQGTPSWKWYYPEHYSPFAGDFKGIKKLDIQFGNFIIHFFFKFFFFPLFIKSKFRKRKTI